MQLFKTLHAQMGTLSNYVVVIGAVVVALYWFTDERRSYQQLHTDVQEIKQNMASKSEMQAFRDEMRERFDRMDAKMDTLNQSILVTRSVLNIPSFIKDTLQLREYYVQIGKR